MEKAESCFAFKPLQMRIPAPNMHLARNTHLYWSLKACTFSDTVTGLKGASCQLSGIGRALSAKMKTGQNVTVGLIEKMCHAFDCDYGDFMESVADGAQKNGGS